MLKKAAKRIKAIKNSFCAALILPSFLIVLLAVLACWALGLWTAQQYRIKSEELYTMILENSADAIDEKIAGAEEVLDAVMAEPGVLHFFNDDAAADANTLCPMLGAYQMKENYVKKVYLYNSGNGMAADSKTLYPDFQTFWELCLKPLGISQQSCDVFLQEEEIRREYIALGNSENKKDGDVQLVQFMPVAYGNKVKGFIGIVLDEKALLEPYQRDLRKDGTELYILDRDGQIVLSAGSRYSRFILENAGFFNVQYELCRTRPDHKKWGEPVFVCNLFSKHHNWSIAVIVPSKVIVNGSGKISLYLAAISILILIFTAAAAAKIAGKKKREFDAVFKELNEYGANTKTNAAGIEFVKDRVHTLLLENKDYKRRLELQEQDIRYKVLDKLINGSYLTDGEIEKELKKAGIILPDGKVILLLIYISELYSDEKNFADVKKEMIHSLYQITDRYAYVHDMDARKIAVFCFVQNAEDGRAVVTSMVSKIRTQIEPAVFSKLAYGVGSMANSPVAISDSYRHAMEVLRYNMAGYTRECLWYEDLSKDEDAYSYSLATETQLYDYAILGNSVEVSRLIDRIYHDNFVIRTISYQAAAGLTGELRSTVIKICSYIEKTYPDVEFDSAIPPSAAVTEVFEAVHGVLERVCACVNENNKSKAKKTSEKIVEYVGQNFMKSNISLTDVALKFNLSEKYISSVFKEYTGENFSVYIETKRIEMACRLISGGSRNMNEIASQVGYSNDITFRRAFKRRKEVTPTAYAEMVRNEHGPL